MASLGLAISMRHMSSLGASAQVDAKAGKQDCHQEALLQRQKLLLQLEPHAPVGYQPQCIIISDLGRDFKHWFSILYGVGSAMVIQSRALN